MAGNQRIEELRRRVQSDPASIAFAALAEEYRRAGQFEAAIATCRTGLRRHPAYVSAHVTLGRALIEVGQYEEARQELEYVLKIAPENLAAIRALADIHHRAGGDAARPEAASEPPRNPLPWRPRHLHRRRGRWIRQHPRRQRRTFRSHPPFRRIRHRHWTKHARSR